MTAGIVLAIVSLTVIWVTRVWGRAHEGKPRLLLATIVVSIASGVFWTDRDTVGSGHWVLNAVGLISGLIALTLYTARNCR